MDTQTFFWPRTERIPSLLPEHVHVWAWDLDIPPLPRDWKILGEEETLRARRFVFPRDRDRYVRAHSRMREVLSGYSGAMPEAISFSSNAYGKPQMQHAPNAPVLAFNLSHSADIAVLAVSRSYPLGLDIERVRSIDRDVADSHFSPRELRTLQSLPPDEWLTGFYRCWTGKEALLKGEGLGLNLPLDAFDVESDPQLAPALLASRPPANFAPGWRMIDLRPVPDAIGTLAVQDRTGSFSADAVRCFSLSG